ncbi:MAG: heavy-metal-associated domain-containing protein, partial [Lachnospiraceae bacterium]|nr:heavy-metal-associated domain-containing protein [Lachnospiraceae bacterium]
RVYILENLGCPNCAAKMEQRIQALPGVSFASVTYATKQLRLSADHQEELLPQIQEICASIESEVCVVPRGSTATRTAAPPASLMEYQGSPHTAAN